MKFGDVVIYKEFGQEYPALVVGSRELEHHGGANDEPLINLVFVRSIPDPSDRTKTLAVSGTSRESELIQFRHDIAHESHAFSEEAAKELSDKGLLPPGGAVPGGRYVLASVVNAEPPAQLVASTEGEAVAPEQQAPASSAGDSADSGDAQSEVPAKETVQ